MVGPTIRIVVEKKTYKRRKKKQIRIRKNKRINVEMKPLFVAHAVLESKLVMIYGIYRTVDKVCSSEHHCEPIIVLCVCVCVFGP